MLDTIKKNRAKVSLELYEAGKSGFLSPAVCLGDREIAGAIENHASGKLLDIGCGEMPYRNLILPKVEVYDTLDIEKRHPGVKYLGDVQNMTEIRSSTYDTATCFAVLEHVPDPLISFKELARVLKPQGKLILTVPHLSRLHEEPHDYFRFTKYGIKAALEAEGFEILELKPVGLVVHGQPPIEDWMEAGEKLKLMGKTVQWWLGDWLNYGDAAYGEKYSQALEDTDYKYQTLANLAWVASRIGISRRANF